MSAAELFRDIQDETGADDTAAAILVLAQIIQNKRLLLEDGEAIAHGIYMGLKPITEDYTPLVQVTMTPE